MKISFNWLKNYIDINDLTPQQLSEKLNIAGIPVEEIIEKKPEIENIFTAKILKIEKHPNADKLSLCSVTDGDTTYKVVCGAKNIKEGDIVPLAKIGAKLSGGIKIKKSKIRGIESEGMLCSAKELGISDDHSGILIFDKNQKIGEPFIPFENDTILVLEITPNRPDLLSIIGIARFISSILNKPIKYPSFNIADEYIDKSLDINNVLKVKTLNPDKCPRYTARIIKGVKIQESPQWLKNILISIGIRPINNVVDITNFILFELNQPLHAFDYKKIKNNTIIIRDANNSEKIIALDGKEYKLDSSDLIIADNEKPIAIAGVMGGEFSSVDSNTTDIVLESAYFLPSSIRKTSKKLRLSSDSSYRFERGVDIENVINALNRATKLIIEIAGGKTSKNYIDIYKKKYIPTKIKLRVHRVNEILGTNLSNNQIENLISNLYFNIIEKNNENLLISPPSWRVDIKKEIDIIEDIAQIYGYNNIPLTYPLSLTLPGKDVEINYFINKLSNLLISYGFWEVKNFSFLNNKFIKDLEIEYFPENPVILKNPFNEEETILKTTLTFDLIKNLIFNYNNQNENIHLFEIANIYHFINNEYIQIPKIAAISYNHIILPTYTKKEFKTDLFYLKTIIYKIYSILNTKKEISFQLEQNTKYPILEYALSIKIGDICIGVLGQLKEEILYKNKFKNKAYIFELDINELFKLYDPNFKYKKISSFPSVSRDLSIILKENIPEIEVEKIIKNIAGNILKDIYLYDIYKGEQIPDGHKSLTFNILLQSDKKTLNENDINKLFSKIIDTLKEKLNAQLR